MEAFDYIVVGAGSAGCLVAERLSADGSSTVLLLEAGTEDSNPLIADPRRWTELLGSEVDWGYVTEPQSNADGRRIRWPRGRVLGGSSSINAMVHMRGCRADYDNWARSGCHGWNYDAVLPAFVAIEDFAAGDSGYHGSGGRLSLTIPESVNPLSEAVLEAALDLGFPFNSDFNGKDVNGAGWNQLAISKGTRVSSAVAFLRPAIGRPNLTVHTSAQVTRLVVEAGRVRAVEYVSGNRTRFAAVGAEAVLCAGVIESPKLLMLSGIGPVAQLESHGIPVAVESPEVGANLHDHPGIGVTFTAKRPIPPAVNQGSEFAMFARLDEAATKPQVQFGVTHMPYVAEGFSAPPNSFTFYPSWTTPESRGSVSLRSASPTDPPLIDPQYLAAGSDLDGLVGAIGLSRELARGHGLRDWTGVEVVPGPDVRDRAALRQYVRKAMDTWFHAVGTCRMGSDDSAVVDPTLRVRGVDNLRVADASVMPTVPVANTNAPTLMIAQRCSEFMLGQA